MDLREGDFAAINSSVKCWLYADLLEKPSETVMCRPPSHGGLGVYSVKYKAQALLTRTFLETAVIPKFCHSLLHSNMYRFHVLGDTTVYLILASCPTTLQISLTPSGSIKLMKPMM